MAKKAASKARAQTQKRLDRSANAGRARKARYTNVNTGTPLAAIQDTIIKAVNKALGTNREGTAEHSKRQALKGDKAMANKARKKAGPSSKPNTSKSNSAAQRRSHNKKKNT